MRRQIKNVILHDPGRHDQQRFFKNPRCLRRILNQFHQMISIHHSTRRYRDFMTRAKFFGTNRRMTTDRALPVFDQILPSAQQISSAFANRMLQNLGIGRNKIHGRHHVQPLPCYERHDFFMMCRHATNTRSRVVPPLLLQKKILIDEAKRPLLPLLCTKSPVLYQRLDAGSALMPRHLARHIQ